MLRLAGDRLGQIDWYEFIKIETTFTFDLAAIQKENPNSVIAEDMLPAFAACEAASRIADVLCLAQLAYPARLHSSDGRSWVDGKAFNAIPASGGFPYDVLLPTETQWPNVHTVSLQRVSAWEQKLGLFEQGVAKTPIQRALASFTHAAAPPVSSGGEALFWTMQGLESFYCRGTGDLRRQLSEKSRLFLGPWNDKKNIVGRMYDLRSKFVHGSFSLERWNNGRMLDEADRPDSDEFYSAYVLAIRMLFATLHRCVNEEIIAAEFDYRLSIQNAAS